MDIHLKLTSPFVMVIFGATGDLTQRKLLPALFHLYQKKILPEQFFIVGFSRREYNNDQFKEFCLTAIKKHDPNLKFNNNDWTQFINAIYFQRGEFDDVSAYQSLIEKLKQFDDQIHACVPRYFYLATPPDKYENILTNLHETK